MKTFSVTHLLTVLNIKVSCSKLCLLMKKKESKEAMFIVAKRILFLVLNKGQITHTPDLIEGCKNK